MSSSFGSCCCRFFCFLLFFSFFIASLFLRCSRFLSLFSSLVRFCLFSILFSRSFACLYFLSIFLSLPFKFCLSRSFIFLLLLLRFLLSLLFMFLVKFFVMLVMPM